jgi:hypothetical protein
MRAVLQMSGLQNCFGDKLMKAASDTAPIRGAYKFKSARRVWVIIKTMTSPQRWERENLYCRMIIFKKSRNKTGQARRCVFC